MMTDQSTMDVLAELSCNTTLPVYMKQEDYERISKEGFPKLHPTESVIFTVHGHSFFDKPNSDPCSATCARELTDWKKALHLLIYRTATKSTDFMSQFSAATDNGERVRLCTDNQTITKHLTVHFDQWKVSLEGCYCHDKYAEKAADFCSLVSIKSLKNSEYPMIEYLKAFKMLTYGLMFAPHGGKEAALLYGKRSSASFSLKQYENALDDIKRALDCGYAQVKPQVKPAAKLLNRMAECLLRLGRTDEMKRLLSFQKPGTLPPDTPEGIRWLQLVKLSAISDRKVVKRAVNLSKYQEASTVIDALAEKGKFKPHARFPWLNAKIDLLYDAEKGFHLHSNAKLAYGEIAAIGKPFAAFATITLATQYDRCHQCFTQFPQFVCEEKEDEKVLAIQQLPSGPIRMAAPLPCTGCPNAVYCSETCRTEAWKTYHRFECSQLLALGELDHGSHLALRMLYSVGSWEALKQAITDWETTEDKLQLAKNPRHYAFIYSMPLPEVRDAEDELRLTVTACFLAKLAQLSGFVPDTLEDEHFAARILLRHLLQIKSNIYVPTPNDHSKQTEASSVNGIASTMAFSCEPNIGCKSLFTDGLLQSTVQVFYVARALEAGVQLSLSHNCSTGECLLSHFDRSSSLVIHFNTCLCPCSHSAESRLKELSKAAATRSAAILQQCGRICKCTRCLQEQRDSLDAQRRLYIPIACPACRSLMVRVIEGESTAAAVDAGYRCSAVGCLTKMSTREMKSAYKQVGKFTDLVFPRLFATKIKSVSEVNESPAACRAFYLKLQTELAKVVPLLERKSPFLATLYLHVSVLFFHKCGPRGPSVNSTLLCQASLYAEKALAVCEAMYDGAGMDNGLVRNCLTITGATVVLAARFNGDQLAKECQGEGEPYCIIEHSALAEERLGEIKKRTAYDQMLTSVV